jgi:cysteine desulfurase/selenocysteine lyase
MESKTLSESDIQRFRADTTGTAGRIHFNNAGASMPPDVVVETVIRYLNEEATQGGYETEDKYEDELENVYALVARLINADKAEVAIVESASFAWGQAFHGIDFKKGDEIITSEMEYATNLIGFLNVQKMQGVSFIVIPNDEQGEFSVAALEAAITPKTRLIAITHIPSGAGNILPIVEIGKIASKHHILYLVDACQTVGQMPIDVRAIGCDILSVTGRKFLRAPRGTGFLYVRKAAQDQLNPLMIDGHSIQTIDGKSYQVRNDARRFELYEKNRGLMLGLGAAIDYALAIGLDRIWQRVQYLAALMRRELSVLPGITVHDSGGPQCGIVTFSVAGADSETVKAKLAEKKINVSVGSVRSTLLYMNKKHLTSTVRASVHYYNTEEEIKIMCKVLSS